MCMLVFRRKCFLLYCTWSHLENYSLLLHSAKSQCQDLGLVVYGAHEATHTA